VTVDLRSRPSRLIGERLLALGEPAQQRLWIRRRNEVVTLQDERVAIHEIDFHLDLRFVEPWVLTLAPGTDQVVLPLLRLSRRRHARFEIFDGSGAVLPLPNRSEERRLVADGIACAAATKNSEGFVEIRDAIFRYIAAPPPIEATHPVGWLRRRLHRWWLWFGRLIGESEPSPDLTSERDRFYRELNGLGLTTDGIEQIAPLLDQYRVEHWLLAEVPIKTVAVAGSRSEVPPGGQVVKVRFVEPVLPKKYGAWRLIRRIVAGSLSTGMQFEISSATHCDSLHVYVQSPRGFRVVDAGVACTWQDRDSRDHLRNRWIPDDDSSPSAAHFFLDSDAFPFDTRVIAATSFYSYRTGFFLESWFLTLATALLFLGFTRHLQQSGFELGHAVAFDPNFASTLLLLFPALAVTIVTQRDDHRLCSRTFALPRFLLFGIAVASVGASLPFAMQLPKDGARVAWFASSIVVWVITLRFTLSAVVHLWRVSKVRTAWQRLQRVAI
jgi:hypothetical protein